MHKKIITLSPQEMGENGGTLLHDLMIGTIQRIKSNPHSNVDEYLYAPGGAKDMIKEFLKQEISLNARDNNNKTVLELALESGIPQLVDLIGSFLGKCKEDADKQKQLDTDSQTVSQENIPRTSGSYGGQSEFFGALKLANDDKSHQPSSSAPSLVKHQ